ncbi:MAG: hypothetical protein M3R59_09745 [Verrucomicrobiota bacterium]|nr:hypothetical protein [Verrucomicrobiota bacterium]
MIGTEKARAFFEQAAQRFAERDAQTSVYSIGGGNVRIRATSGFDFVHRALAYLRCDKPTPVDLEIFAWHNAAGGTEMPSPPWSTDDYGPRGEIAGCNDARFATAFDHAGSSLSMFDRATRRAIFWTRDTSALPQADYGAPLKTILHWWAESIDRVFLHGGGVGNERGAVLLAGTGGSGKSTSALYSAASGLHYLGDDYCMVDLEQPPALYSCYGTGKLAEQADLEFKNCAPAEEAKALFYVNENPAMKMSAALPLLAIFVPQIERTATRTTIVPTTPSEALKALAPSTISQLPGAGAATFQRLAKLVRMVPSYRLLLARDVDAIGDTIRAFLEQRAA